MATNIDHSYSPDHVEVASGAIQAAMMHFGGSKESYPNLLGDIPTRPFLGFSESDRDMTLNVLQEWLDRAWQNPSQNGA